MAPRGQGGFGQQNDTRHVGAGARRAHSKSEMQPSDRADQQLLGDDATESCGFSTL